jgi:hypothetical protein
MAASLGFISSQVRDLFKNLKHMINHVLRYSWLLVLGLIQDKVFNGSFRFKFVSVY